MISEKSLLEGAMLWRHINAIPDQQIANLPVVERRVELDQVYAFVRESTRGCAGYRACHRNRAGFSWAGLTVSA